MDLVVNHSSDRHAWFQAALKDPFGKYGKYYVFREGKDGKEPNNWRSIFGGSAWEKVPGYDNLYYLHIFTKEQPDLNWENPKLREEIYEMILKWMDLGLGGFRLDAISHLKKNYQYTNLPPDGPDEYNMAFEYFNNVDGLADILCEMKERTFAPTDALTIGEYDHMGPEDVEDVIGENGSFSSVFDFVTPSTMCVTRNGAIPWRCLTIIAISFLRRRKSWMAAACSATFSKTMTKRASSTGS